MDAMDANVAVTIDGAVAAAQAREEAIAARRLAYRRARYGGTLPEEEPRTISCHVGYEGNQVSVGHIESLAGVGWNETAQRAIALGWVDCGDGRWTCPPCAHDPEPIFAIKVALRDMGSCIFTKQADADVFARELIENDEAPEDVIVTTYQTTRGEINCLREFDGF
jgi:hypothetical protein